MPVPHLLIQCPCVQHLGHLHAQLLVQLPAQHLADLALQAAGQGCVQVRLEAAQLRTLLTLHRLQGLLTGLRGGGRRGVGGRGR